MRVTGGICKGKSLLCPKGNGVRPTSSKVRESIFNILQLSQEGTNFYDGKTIFLDLFAGSGIMGMEALSRGASQTVFVEKNCLHSEILKKNLKNFGEFSHEVVVSDAVKFLQNTDKNFNLIFIDPPYASNLYQPVLNEILQKNILADDGIIILEHAKSFLPDVNGFELYKTKNYGDTSITIIRKY